MKILFQKFLLWIFRLLPESWVIKLAGGKPITIRGRTIEPLLQLMWQNSKREKPLTEMTPQAARASVAEAFKIIDGKPRKMASISERTIPGPGGEMPVRIYTPTGAPPAAPVMLYFHQGGCVIGDIETGHTFCTVLADVAKCIMVNVDYRLAPEHKYPAALDDAAAAYQWAIDNASEIGGDPKRVGVSGDSAGGLLCAVTTHAMKKSGGQQPILQVLVYPWVVSHADYPSYDDFADAFPLNGPIMEYFGAEFLNDDSEREDLRLCPLHEPDFTGLAPAIIATAGFDPLSDEGEAYAKKLEEAGVPVTFRCYESLTHSFAAMNGSVPAAKAAVEEIAENVRKALSA